MIICVVGPTAVGKTALSIALAKKYNAIIINCDAMQVYKGLDIGTAKATKKEQEVNKNFPLNCFVLENLGIDSKMIIVDEDGKVYLLQYDKKMFLCNSISEHLDMCIEKNK